MIQKMIGHIGVGEDKLKGNVHYFITKNQVFDEKYKKYNITSYDTSYNRESLLDDIISKYK